MRIVRVAVSMLALVLASCGDSSSTSTSTSGGGGGGSVTLDASKVFKGNLSLSGTITLPPGTGAGKSVQLTVSARNADITKSGSQIGSAGSTPGDSVPYTITGLSEGKYSIRARIDVDGNGVLGSGDLDGYSGGTADAPVTDEPNAKEIDVGPSGATGVDFGVAKVP